MNQLIQCLMSIFDLTLLGHTYKKITASIITNPSIYRINKDLYSRKCPDKRCECCASLFLGNSYTFKNVDKTFSSKAHFSCDSSNLLCIIICPTCGEEYNVETGVDKTKLRNRVRVYRHNIRKPEYQKLEVGEHFRTCGKDTFKILPLLQMQISEIDLCRSYERNFMKKYKTRIK